MNKVAILVPTFSGHTRYFSDFLTSCSEYKISETVDIWYVISENDRYMESYSDERILPLVIPSDIIGHSTDGIINKKKIWGLIELKDKYEYIIVLDDDTSICKNVNLGDLCEEYFGRKLLLGNFALDKEIVPKVIECVEKHFSRDAIKRFEDETHGRYLWFNQPGIYKCSTIDEFLEKTKLRKKLNNLTWYDFDYYIYMIYLICYENFRVEDAGGKSAYGICEALDDRECRIKDCDNMKKYAYQLTDYMRKKLRCNPVFLIHVDRKYERTTIFSRVKKYLKIILQRK